MLSSRFLSPIRRQRLSTFPIYDLRAFHALSSHRPQLRRLDSYNGRRTNVSEAGEDDSGHILTKQNEGIFFFDNIFPLRLQWLAKIPFLNPDRSIPDLLKRVNNPNAALSDPAGIIQLAMPSSLPLTVTEIIPRVRDGGAYVKFSHDSSISPESLESALKGHLKEKPIRPWFNPFRRVTALLVQGKPWIEDLYRIPSSRLKVEFLPTSPEASAAELSQETLFSLFRKFGKLAEITPQPPDSKIVPRYAIIDYERKRFGCMAKNCMHGYILPESGGGGKTGTRLNVRYEARQKSHWYSSWITNHPRIAIPIIVAVLTSLAVVIFDPIRVFSIKSHITHGLSVSEITDQPIVKWVKKQLLRGYNYIRFNKAHSEDDSPRIVWEDRQAQIQQVQTWLIETADTFIVVHGPRGAGKREFVMDEVLKDRRNKLLIDCKRVQEARGEARTISAAAAEVGYRPVFTWMNSISSLIDLAAMGTIGTKTGFSETLESQLGRIWNLTATALKETALANRKADDKDAQLADDEWLEAHPEHRPVVVIDNFLHKAHEGNSSLIYDKLAEWGALLTSSNIAHVIFLTANVSFSKSLGKALPDRIFRQITLGDCSPEVAKRVVISRLEASNDLEATEDEKKKKQLQANKMRADLGELDGVISVLGGRLTDLDFLARRIRSGESPGSAVRQMIEQSASEILKIYLIDTEATPREWNPQQAWLLIKELAANESLRYNEVLLMDSFKSNGDRILQALEQAELITITATNGRPQTIKPGKPVYQAAFEYLTADEVLKARLDLAIVKDLIGSESATVDKCEKELQVLAGLPNAPDLRPRIHYLLRKVLKSQSEIDKLEARAGVLKKVIKEKW
ncbi:hypothetical protein DV735_g1947, partial [Chaetothyriales sp. CBS 134920]